MALDFGEERPAFDLTEHVDRCGLPRARHAALNESAAAEEERSCPAECVDMPRAQAWEAMRRV